jgi:hypothetical protein
MAGGAELSVLRRVGHGWDAAFTASGPVGRTGLSSSRMSCSAPCRRSPGAGRSWWPGRRFRRREGIGRTDPGRCNRESADRTERSTVLADGHHGQRYPPAPSRQRAQPPTGEQLIATCLRLTRSGGTVRINPRSTPASSRRGSSRRSNEWGRAAIRHGGLLRRARMDGDRFASVKATVSGKPSTRGGPQRRPDQAQRAAE